MGHTIKEKRSACLVFGLVLTALSAQAGYVDNSTPPTATEIQKTMSSLVLCDWHQVQQINQVVEYLWRQQAADKTSDGLIYGTYKVLNTEFKKVGVMAGGKEMAAFSLAPKGNMATLARALEKSGRTMTQEVLHLQKNRVIAALSNTRITPDTKTKITVMAGQLNAYTNAFDNTGITLMCSQTRPTDEESLVATGVISSQSVAQVIYQKEQQPSEWVDRLLDKGHADHMVSLADYQWLAPAQTARLLALRAAPVDMRLAANTSVALSTAQIDSLLHAKQLGVLLALVQNRFEALTPIQRDALLANPLTAKAATLKQGGPESMLLFEAALKSQSMAEFQQALTFLTPWTSEMVDAVLTHGSQEVRSWMAMQTRTAYSASQIDRMLQDPASSVQIGVLRRKDLAITRAQYDKGINHPDRDISFWYQTRAEHTPNAAQIQTGLSSPDTSTRRGWVLDERFALTQAQIDAGLNDAEIRAAMLGRQNITLNPQQMDACTVDEDVSTRFACVGRADYVMTQARFIHIVNDWNGNVLRTWLNRKAVAAVSLEPFVNEAIRSADSHTLMAIAKNKDIPISASNIALAQQLSNTKVQLAFCERLPDTCANNKLPLELDELSVRRAILQKASQAFLEDDFAALEQEAADMHKQQRRTKSGVFKLEVFYNGVFSAISPQLEKESREDAFISIEKQLDQWHALYPQSPRPFIIKARAHIELALQYRDPKTGMAATEKGYALMRQHFADAKRTLMDNKAIASTDPAWYEVILSFASYNYWSKADIEPIINEAIERFPLYLAHYDAALMFLSPGCNGSKEDMDAFVVKATEKTKHLEGESLYARLYWYILNKISYNEPFQSSVVQWPRMKAGFEDVIKRYPDNWNLNHYAKFACFAQDKPKTRELIARIKSDIIDEAWPPQTQFIKCQQWANAN